MTGRNQLRKKSNYPLSSQTIYCSHYLEWRLITANLFFNANYIISTSPFSWWHVCADYGLNGGIIASYLILVVLEKN